MDAMLSPFWARYAIGFVGLLLWVLTHWANPADDTLTGTLKNAVGGHSRTVFVSILSYTLLAILLESSQEFTAVGAVTAGYMNHSLVQQSMDAWAAKRKEHAGP